jgi:DNA-binding NarL/FixJ family response regulator
LVVARKKILCIEGDRETAAVIAEQFENRGFEITTAYDGQEGFLAILKAKPDLVLCDVDVPVMSSFEVLERLNQIVPPKTHLPFVFLTAHPDRDIELKGRQLGADDFVTKPIDIELLATIINARLARVARTKLWPRRAELNGRELEVLTWVARGKTSADIAHKLHLTKRTVDFHSDNARSKLRAATRTEAAIKAAVGGLIKP